MTAAHDKAMPRKQSNTLLWLGILAALLGFILLIGAGAAEAKAPKPSIKGAGYVNFDGNSSYGAGEFSIDAKGTPKKASGRVYFRISTWPDPAFREEVIGRVTCLNVQGVHAHATGVVTEIGEGWEYLRYFEFVGRDDPDQVRLALHSSPLTCTDPPCHWIACATGPIVDGRLAVNAARGGRSAGADR
jgi:hypothetical protein